MTAKKATSEATDCASTEGIEIFDQSDGHDRPMTVDVEPTPSDWTPEEAAKHLGKSVRTIRRMLQDGTLKGHKVSGKRRDEWRVKPVNMTECKSVTDTSSSEQHRNENERLWDLLKDKDIKIEVLVMRTGYLEALLAERDKEIKLLTDKTDKVTENRHWWHRFSAWFLGVSQ